MLRHGLFVRVVRSEGISRVHRLRGARVRFPTAGDGSLSISERPDSSLGSFCDFRSIDGPISERPDRQLGSFCQFKRGERIDNLNIQSDNWVRFVNSHARSESFGPGEPPETTLPSMINVAVDCNHNDERSCFHLCSQALMAVSIPPLVMETVAIHMIPDRLLPSTPSMERGAASGRMSAMLRPPNCQRFL